MSKFSVVATPIGNLGDITFRAIEILTNASVIFCEDTRVTKRLLDNYSINVKTESYHSHSKISKKEEIISLLKEGKDIALVSDAGTPGISDPGIELVRYIKEQMSEELKNGLLKIETIPGPSALTSAIAISGVPCAEFTFLGFLPHKKGRETLFKEIASSERTMIFYESPHRIMKTLESLSNHCQLKRVTVCKELTKIFEEVVSGTSEEVKNFFENNKEKIKGEFVVLVSDF